MNHLLRHSVSWGLLGGAWLVVAAPFAAAGPSVNFGWLRDMQVTVYARRALMEDPALARLNLGVNVRDGIATVWGPVPNEEVGKQAVKKVELAKGVLQVRSDLYVYGPKKDEAIFDLPLVFEPPEQPTKTESASPKHDAGRMDSLTTRVNPLALVDPATAGLNSSVSLMPPVAIVEVPLPAISATTPARADPVAASIDRLRLNDERFRPIATELKDHAVLVRAGKVRGEHVMAFAQAVSQLPGVERVVVLNNGP